MHIGSKAKPSKEDWTIGNTVTLQVGDSQASATQWSVLYDKDSLESNPNNSPEENLVRMDVEGGRCVMVDFSVGHHNQPETLTLTVPELERSIPEMISDAEIQKAREKLSAQGIEMDWVSSFGGGPNGPIIKKKPDEMSDQQVIRLFYAALGYYYPGPWVFTVDINP